MSGEAEGSVAPEESAGSAEVLQQIAVCETSGLGHRCSLIDYDSTEGGGHGSVGYTGEEVGNQGDRTSDGAKFGVMGPGLGARLPFLTVLLVGEAY